MKLTKWARRSLLASFSTLAFVTAPVVVAAPVAVAKNDQRQTGRPNVVIILLDDAGFGASSTFGGVARTPVLSSLAKQGLTYNNFNTTALCSPTRAALLTGRNHHRVGFGMVSESLSDRPGYNGKWQKDAASIADVLKLNGYSTAAIGKWHNTPYQEMSPVGPFDRWPTGLGFEYYYGFMRGEVSQWEPPLYENTTALSPPARADQGYHVTTDSVNHAISWLHTHQSLAPNKPYFLYFATGAVHDPLHVAEEWIVKYKGKFDQGWDKLREETFARQKKLGVIPSDAKLTPRPAELPAWDSLNTDQKRLASAQMEVFAAFMEQADFEVGRLLKEVQSGPGGDNTLIMYVVGDNGASGEGGLEGSDHKMADYLFGMPTPAEEQLTRINDLGGPTLDNHFATPWAWAMNTPFPWMKQVASHLGGIRNPLIVSWPAHISADSRPRSQFTHVTDIAPTIYDIAGITPPSIFNGVKQMSFDGVSFAKSFTDTHFTPAAGRVQYYEMTGSRALYKDGWLASARHGVPWSLKRGGDFDGDRWELYNLNVDYSQSQDLASKNPEKLAELRKLFDQEAQRNNVYPLTAPGDGRSTLVSTKAVATEFKFFPDLPIIPSAAAPDFTRSHRIVADVVIPAEGASGVIVSNGNRFGGFVLYMDDGKLIYENNVLGKKYEKLISSGKISAGPVKVTYEYDLDTNGGAEGRLLVNEKLVASGPVSRLITPFSGTFEIGRASTSPIGQNHFVPYAFTGSIKHIYTSIK